MPVHTTTSLTSISSNTLRAGSTDPQHRLCKELTVVAKTDGLTMQRLAQSMITTGTGADQEREGVGVWGHASAAHLVEQAEREAERGDADEGVEGERREG
jgi:hypothetical protein